MVELLAAREEFHLISAKGAMGANLAETDSEQRHGRG